MLGCSDPHRVAAAARRPHARHHQRPDSPSGGRGRLGIRRAVRGQGTQASPGRGDDGLRQCPAPVPAAALPGRHGHPVPGRGGPPAREILRSQKNLDVLLGTVTDVDLGERQVTAVTGEHVTTLPYDSLIVATGARQSHFGHPEFEQFAPGIKNIDDALELRSRIFGAFEMAELLPPGPEQDSWMTFVVVGGGPTGVEMAGQLRELARRSLPSNFRHIDPTKARVLLVDGADEVLATFGHKQADYTRRKLESLGVQVELGQMVVGVDDNGATLRSKDGTETGSTPASSSGPPASRRRHWPRCWERRRVRTSTGRAGSAPNRI